MRVRLRTAALLVFVLLPVGFTADLALTFAAERTTIDAFVEASADAGVVVLGERHDNPVHHDNQARIVAALRPDALVFEMIPQENEDEVNALRVAGASRTEIAAALDWEASGWPDFDYYAEILEAAPEARVFGGGQPSADVRRASMEGAAGAFGPDAAIYGLDLPLEPEEQAAREALQAAAHCGALPPEVLPGMVEAQRFRDAGLADAALWARTMTGGGTVVVITGNGHADKARGMPAAATFADPEVRIVSLGQLESGETDGGVGVFDFTITAPVPPRGDPCEAFAPAID